MPLTKSKSPKAFGHNVEAEMHAGKPQKQALAIAYSVKRHARKMAKGGMVTPEQHLPKHEQDHDGMIEQAKEPMEHVRPEMTDADHRPEAKRHMHENDESHNEIMKENHLAHGGEVVDHNEHMEGDIDNFLSDEEDDESPFQDRQSSSDEEELTRMGDEASSHMNNEKSDSDEMQSRKGVLERILRQVRMRNIGR